MELATPDVMPMLGQGAHRGPTQGACFMEYTALLAGLPFNDRPECTDRQLGRVMMTINDSMPGPTERTRLVPLLGRAIGLVAPGRATELQLWACGAFKAKVAAHYAIQIDTIGSPLGAFNEVLIAVVNRTQRYLDTEDYLRLATWIHEAYEEAMAALGIASGDWQLQRGHAEVRRMMKPHEEYMQPVPIEQTAMDTVQTEVTIVNGKLAYKIVAPMTTFTANYTASVS